MTRFIYRLARWTAIVGGIVLCAMTLLIVTSISGRALMDFGLGPVPGDFELVEIGTGIAVFFFLPWCYLRGGHATVDLLYMHFPAALQRAVVIFSDLLMLGVWLLLTWRLWEGLVEKHQYMETTFILAIPVWWGYAFCMVGAVVGCLAYLAKTLTRVGIGSEPAEWAAESGGGH